MSDTLDALSAELIKAKEAEAAAIAALHKRMGPNISVINQSTVVSDADAIQVVAALQIQMSRDFAPAWGLDATLDFVAHDQPTPAGHWQLVILDHSPQADALGWHDVTREGLPTGKIFAKSDLDAGTSWSVTASHELCMTGDTKIPLLNGTETTIKNLVGASHFWVYSCDDKGRIRAGRGHSARLTQKDAQLVAVLLDNGETIRCTPDHPFLKRSGEYCPAATLHANDSLMPLYRQLAVMDPKKKRKGMYEYEQVYVPARGGYEFTHRVVRPYCSSGYVRHHIDFNRFNNSPDNLDVIPWLKHQQIHADHIREVGRQFWKDVADGKRVRKKRIWSIDQRREASERIIRYNRSEKHRLDMCEYYSRPGVLESHAMRLSKYGKSEKNLLHLKAMRELPGMKSSASRNITAYNKSATHRAVAAQLRMANPLLQPAFTNHIRWHKRRGIASPDCGFCAQVSPANHKVVSVTPCGREDVFDFTVDEFHNFATSAGVFVHNCEMRADPDIARCVLVESLNGGRLYALEVGDAPEADQFGYRINGVLVSDFVYPAWFESFWEPKRTQFDYGNHIDRPFQIITGGYIGYMDVNSTDGWQQLTADLKPNKKARAPIGSRRERRRIPRSQWLRSTQ